MPPCIQPFVDWTFKEIIAGRIERVEFIGDIFDKVGLGKVHAGLLVAVLLKYLNHFRSWHGLIACGTLIAIV